MLYVQPAFIEVGFDNIHQVSVVFGDNKLAICAIGNILAKCTWMFDLSFYGEVVKAGLLKIKCVKTCTEDIIMLPTYLPNTWQHEGLEFSGMNW